MTIYTVQFDYDGQTMYKRLLDVFKKSITRVMPEVNFMEETLKSPGEKKSKIHSLLSNTLKLREWRKWMDATNDQTVFMDCDMLLLHSIASAFEEDFDVAYTVRTSAKMPMNGGVVFAKPTDGARRFFKAWLDVNERMFKDRKFHEPYRVKYAGMNQAAFGYLLENPVAGVKLLPLPCAIWNACSEDWRFIDGYTRVVHIKSFLRKLCILPEQRTVSGFVPIVQIWKKIEQGIDVDSRIEALNKFNELNNLKLNHLNKKLMYIEGDPKANGHKSQIEKRIRVYAHNKDKDLVLEPTRRSYKNTRKGKA